MERKGCFGTIQEFILENGLIRTNAKPECRNCDEVRDCLRFAKQAEEEKKERDELRKQTIISQIIDLSVVLSNELGACLLEFLNRIYNSSLGELLFRNFLLFYEIPQGSFSMPLTIPISPAILDLLRGRAVQPERSSLLHEAPSFEPSGEKYFIRIVLIQKSFPNNRKANIGLLAHEVARIFSIDDNGIRQIRATLNDSEKALFRKMDDKQRISWLLAKWGFVEELEALKQEISFQEEKKVVKSHP